MQKKITHLSLTIPLKVISEANRPGKEHWRIKRRRKKDQQSEVLAELQNALLGKTFDFPVEVKLVRIGPKALDSDNLANAFKAVQDAIASKLGIDDGDKTKVQWVYDQTPIGLRHYKVRIEISTIAPGLPPA